MRLVYFLIIQFLSFSLFAQDSTVVYSASIQLLASTQQTPYWIHVNQNGKLPMRGNFVSGQWGIAKIYNPHNPRKLQWSGAVELVTNQSKKTDIFLSSAYIAASLGQLELSVGQRTNMVGILDSTLSLGAMAVSNNSRFFPSIKFSTKEYISLPFFNELISFKASYSDGLLRGSKILLGPVEDVKRTYFHQKSLYLKFGLPDQNFNIWAGLNHQAIWGGEKEIWPVYKYNTSQVYGKVVLGQKQDNRLFGNHFGSYDVGVSLPVSASWRILAYKQSIYDNGSLFKIRNWEDGIIGISMKNNEKSNPKSVFKLNNILVEFISTNNQQNFLNRDVSVVDNLGNYYNSYIYQNGWSYLGRNIGNPMIPPKETTQENLNKDVTEFTNNNRLQGLNVGAMGVFNKINITLKSTFSINKGTFIYPYLVHSKQVSLFLKLERNIAALGGLSSFLIISSDIGTLYPNSTGFSIGLKKQGYLH